MYVLFHFWAKREVLYFLNSGSVEPEVHQFSHPADGWNWSHCQGSVVKGFCGWFAKSLLCLIPCSFWEELPSQWCLKTMAAKTTPLCSCPLVFSDPMQRGRAGRFPFICCCPVWGYYHISEHCCLMEASVVELQSLLFTKISAVLCFFTLRWFY